MRWRTVAGLVVVMLGVAGAASCGDAGGSGNNSAGDGFDVDVGDELPDDFPVDEVPLPDGEVTSAATIGGSGGRSWTLAYDAGDPTTAAARYRDKLTISGFTVEETLTNEAGDLESFVATGMSYVVNAFAGEVPGQTGASILSVTVAQL